MIRYIKNLFSKKETHFPNQKISERDNFIDSIKEMDLSNNEKIELLIKRKFCLSNDEILDSSSLIIDFGCDYYELDELISEIEHIFNLKVQEGGFQLTVGGIKKYVKKKIKNPNYIVTDEDSQNNYWPWSLEQTFYNEHLYGRSLAIKDLLDNNYQILNDESGNPFKELINVTLKYFERMIAEKPNKAKKLLEKHFPLMHPYIKRKISKQETTITIENDIDEQKAFDEFLVFCKNVFCSLYPDKKSRDKQIRQQFKIFHNDLIKFIEEDNE